MIQNLDFAPTFLDYAGVEIPAEMQGRSFRKILEGRTPADWRESIYYHYYEYPAVHAVKRHYGVRTLRYKLIHYYYDIDAWELYDLKNDPLELKLVYDDPQYAGVAIEMKAQLQQLRKLYGDSMSCGKQDGMMNNLTLTPCTMLPSENRQRYAIAAQGSGFALKKLAKPITGKAVFKTRLRTLRTDGTRNADLFRPGTCPTI